MTNNAHSKQAIAFLGLDINQFSYNDYASGKQCYWTSVMNGSDMKNNSYAGMLKKKGRLKYTQSCLTAGCGTKKIVKVNPSLKNLMSNESKAHISTNIYNQH